MRIGFQSIDRWWTGAKVDLVNTQRYKPIEMIDYRNAHPPHMHPPNQILINPRTWSDSLIHQYMEETPRRMDDMHVDEDVQSVVSAVTVETAVSSKASKLPSLSLGLPSLTSKGGRDSLHLPSLTLASGKESMKAAGGGLFKMLGRRHQTTDGASTITNLTGT